MEKQQKISFIFKRNYQGGRGFYASKEKDTNKNGK
jgi:hypothetical protein